MEIDFVDAFELEHGRMVYFNRINIYIIFVFISLGKRTGLYATVVVTEVGVNLKL